MSITAVLSTYAYTTPFPRIPLIALPLNSTSPCSCCHFVEFIPQCFYELRRVILQFRLNKLTAELAMKIRDVRCPTKCFVSLHYSI